MANRLSKLRLKHSTQKRQHRGGVSMTLIKTKSVLMCTYVVQLNYKRDKRLSRASGMANRLSKSRL